MQNLLFLSIFLPNLLFSQVSSWRSPPPSQNSSTTQRTTTTTSSWRNQNPTEFNKPREVRTPVIIDNRPFGWNRWEWNRWSMWGAPGFGWNSWFPFDYWNSWGYRQPARVFYYDSGRKDTIFGKKPVYNFGLQMSSSNQIGGFFAVGTKSYFIMEYNSTYQKDNSTFFPYGNINLVDFPLVNDLVKLKTYYVGIGKRFKRTGVHMMVGGKNEIVRYRGKDDIGYITFPKYEDNSMTIKFGVLHDFKTASFKIDYNPIINNFYFGLGLNF